MKKKILALILAVVSMAALLATLAGCDSDESEGSSSVQFTAQKIEFRSIDQTQTLSTYGLTGDPETSGNGQTYYVADVCVYNSGATIPSTTQNKIHANLFTYGDLTAVGMMITEDYGDLSDSAITPDTYPRWEPRRTFDETRSISGGYRRTVGYDVSESSSEYPRDLRTKEIWRVLVFFDAQPGASDTLRYQSAPVYYRSASDGIDYDTYAVIGSDIHMCLNHEAGEADVYTLVSTKTVYTYTTEIEKTVPGSMLALNTTNIGFFALEQGTEILPADFTLEADGKEYTCRGFLGGSLGYLSDEYKQQLLEAAAAEYGYTDIATAFPPQFSGTSFTGDTIRYTDSYTRDDEWVFDIRFDFGLTEEPDSFKLFYNYNGTKTEITLRD